jgi:bifunctional NMN adenylyltransferase/nudix hydrolase
MGLSRQLWRLIMDSKLNIGVFIGRFQPMHNAHLAVINMALLEMDFVVIVLGSACQAKTVKNPWTSDERKKMIYDSLLDGQRDRVAVIEAKDYLYNDNIWLTALQSSFDHINFNGFRDINLDECNVTLYGHDKDRSTFYLHLFPKWQFKEVGTQGDIDATRVREYFFRKDTLDLKRVCPSAVFEAMKSEIDENTSEYQRLYDEYRHIMSYRAMWSSAPFSPMFVTTDAVLIKSGHVLVVRRRGQPGRGLLALPGGFLREDEKVIDGCLRELKEETQIKLPKDELKKRIQDEKVFDHPDRSLRGRTLTHAFCINLGSGSLPKVKGDDDAEKALWMPLRDVLRKEEEFFEDHWHIISYFCNRF